jgi:UDP-N-acetylglucosamine 2-epimerase
MKIVTVLGARPQFIKAAILSRELRRNNQEIIIHTGQHYDNEMSDVFFKEMGIPEPDYNLEVGSSSHAQQTAEMMIKLEKSFISLNPDMILIYGDTNSTLAAALTAAKLEIPVAHVEAGPRMFDKSVPEEINRIVTDHLSTLLFAPTKMSMENLKNEGLAENAYLTGDVMLDLFIYFSSKADQNSKILKKLGLKKKNYILATVHRARNTNIEENLEAIMGAFLEISELENIVFPVHPRTEKYLKKYKFFDVLTENSNIKLIKPVGYLDMNLLTRNSKKLVTDSGGLQREAYFAQIPCITLDTSTGWPETVNSGWNTLFEDYRNKEFLEKDEISRKIINFEPKGKYKDLFGDGRATQKINSIIKEYQQKLT